VPTTVLQPGHIDHDRAIVFPPGTSVRARTDEAQPAWDRTSGRCSDVYCHGGGKLLAADGAAGIRRTPSWVPGSGAADCGACHGLPPADAAHSPTLTLLDCHRCHRTVDATGALNPATHLNGVVDGP
jgi:predicted CxxxxCH...CXXCH cytochrome family protein